MHLHQPPPAHYTSHLLTAPHGMFTNAGGTSQAPFASLNLGYHVGDAVERVHDNRARVRNVLALRHLVSAHQVHGDRILQVDRTHLDKEIEGYDALISSLPDTGVLIQQADCQGVLLEAPEAKVVAAVHCGWRGSVLDLIGKTIHCLRTEYGVAPASLLAAISPSLGPCCAEFIHYRQELPAWMHAFQVQPRHFDFWAISRQQLLDAGVLAERIDIAGLCTRCNPQFFSYRRACTLADGVTGRNGSIIGLSPAV
ncbi:MAG: polyphenol oxidase family protein [Desulfobulbus sp.]|uniref:polyphenol oxidase family protein n=1 Tax=Desulfobulbus sp. TaxID=895 RepID=UPI00283D303F|nr:polyphenol oxidase family protein [Desulfobulbus sp.]MDR2550697.1 polyphenol oxidase family protein [Desulfobulbus sp.]